MLLSGQGVVVVHGAERFQNLPALFGKLLGHLDKLPPAMSQTVGQNRLQRDLAIPDATVWVKIPYGDRSARKLCWLPTASRFPSGENAKHPAKSFAEISRKSCLVAMSQGLVVGPRPELDSVMPSGENATAFAHLAAAIYGGRRSPSEPTIKLIFSSLVWIPKSPILTTTYTANCLTNFVRARTAPVTVNWSTCCCTERFRI